MKFTELKKNLMTAPPESCYILTGDDSFVVKSAVNMFSVFSGEFRDLNFTFFGKDASISEVIAALLTPPMFSEYRVVCVNDYTGDLKQIKEYLKNPSSTSVLLFTGALTPNFNGIIPLCEIVDCNRLEKSYLEGWVVRKAASQKISVSQKAASLLVEYCNRDMNSVYNELVKLMDYAEGAIDESDVKELVSPQIEYKVFELSEAIAEKNADKAVELVNIMLAENNSAVSLMGMLFNHFRRLLFVSLNPKSDTLSSDLKVKEYAVKVALRQAAKFSPRRLKAVFDRLNSLDAGVKAGKISDKNALVEFVCETVTAG